jgi:hypothetical protein
MNFVELVLTVCTLAQPVACDEQKLVFSSESGSLHGCMIQAQSYIAQWSGDHPALRVVRWRCAPPGSEGDKI